MSFSTLPDEIKFLLAKTASKNVIRRKHELYSQRSSDLHSIYNSLRDLYSINTINRIDREITNGVNPQTVLDFFQNRRDRISNIQNNFVRQALLNITNQFENQFNNDPYELEDTMRDLITQQYDAIEEFHEDTIPEYTVDLGGNLLSHRRYRMKPLHQVLESPAVQEQLPDITEGMYAILAGKYRTDVPYESFD